MSAGKPGRMFQNFRWDKSRTPKMTPNVLPDSWSSTGWLQKRVQLSSAGKWSSLSIVRNQLTLHLAMYESFTALQITIAQVFVATLYIPWLNPYMFLRHHGHLESLSNVPLDLKESMHLVGGTQTAKKLLRQPNILHHCPSNTCSCKALNHIHVHFVLPLKRLFLAISRPWGYIILKFHWTSSVHCPFA